MNKDNLIKKYTKYVENLRWNIRENDINGERLNNAKQQIQIYNEIINDLSLLESPQPSAPSVSAEEINSKGEEWANEVFNKNNEDTYVQWMNRKYSFVAGYHKALQEYAQVHKEPQPDRMPHVTKFITVAELRDLENSVSYTRMVEILCERADKYAKNNHVL